MARPSSQEQTTSAKNLPKEKFEELKSYIETLESKEGVLINVLHKAQEIFGYLPKEVQLFIAKSLDVPSSEVFGVVSFYSYFTTKPRGEHTISVCMGTACFVKGADKVLARIMEKLGVGVGETTSDGKFTLNDVRCIGACGLAPVVTIGEKVYGNVTVEDIDDILDDFNI